MEHISEIIQHIIGSLVCPSCQGNDQEDGPVPDAMDRQQWLNKAGTLVECPMCENGEDQWEEHWHSGGSAQWSAHSAECEHCEGTGELTVHDRCETCGRFEHSKGPKKIADADRIYDRLS